MTSTWIQSAPAASIARTSSPNLAKSEARIDGAILSGRGMAAPGYVGRNMQKAGRQRAPPGCPQPHYFDGFDAMSLRTSGLNGSGRR